MQARFLSARSCSATPVPILPGPMTVSAPDVAEAPMAAWAVSRGGHR